MCLHSKIPDFHVRSTEIKCAEIYPPPHVLHAPYFGLPDFFSIKTKAKKGVTMREIFQFPPLKKTVMYHNATYLRSWPMVKSETIRGWRGVEIS